MNLNLAHFIARKHINYIAVRTIGPADRYCRQSKAAKHGQHRQKASSFLTVNISVSEFEDVHD
jgi:hypothetical protein